MRITEIHLAGPTQISTASDGRITVRLPISVERRCAHKRVVSPGAGQQHEPPLKLTPFQLALIRGHRWLAQLESGEATSMKDIAKREGVDASLVSRLINLTTLAPEVVGAILDDTLPTSVTLLDLGIDPPVLWDEQVRAFALR
ncbi:MAG: LacI family transcriptional regulator [Betaproteobacteria bacterium]